MHLSKQEIIEAYLEGEMTSPQFEAELRIICGGTTEEYYETLDDSGCSGLGK